MQALRTARSRSVRGTPISFRLENAPGDGHYFQGLPDLLEASAAAALQWLDTAVCPAGKRAETTRRVSYPLPDLPTPLQRELPGLF